MSINKPETEFLRSALCSENCLSSLEEFLFRFNLQREKIFVKIEQIPFSKLTNWSFDSETGSLRHHSGKFFSIDGIHVQTNWGITSSWEQPIINQPEIGFLGIIAKKFNGVLHFLMQAKIEPGNINYVQLSPTLQATKSNYTKVHKGNTPLYLQYFNGQGKTRVNVLFDQLQSEQGARFLKKRNRNIIIEIEEEIPVYDNFFWLTLGQIKDLLKYDNLVNMDTRTVISGISFGNYPEGTVEFFETADFRETKINKLQKDFLISAIDTTRNIHSIDTIISWITNLKSEYEINIKKIRLDRINDWIKTDSEIHHKEHKYFSVIAANIEIGNREVTRWTQPIIKSAQEGIIAFIVKKINGIFHFLIQAKIEAGNFDIVELAPTVQCLTGNYRSGMNEYDVPFLKTVLEAPENKIIYKAMQSEEGGRFYKEQNLNIIVEADENHIPNLPENYMWMTLNQLLIFIKFNNYLNIQARSLISVIKI